MAERAYWIVIGGLSWLSDHWQCFVALAALLAVYGLWSLTQ
jgi:hypothetical protein